MLYLNADDITRAGIAWPEITGVIRQALRAVREKNYSQPVKPYLRYGNPKNRIIAMPAYLGGEDAFAGIKWIASFPDNIRHDMPRAHSVTLLNEAATGKPLCVVNSALVSAIRTAGVTGVVVEEYLKARSRQGPLRVGMTGYGPIGKMHARMMFALLGDRIAEYGVYDPLVGNLDGEPGAGRLVACRSWEEAYADADIFITCTVSATRYVNRAPRPGSLQLNVSLRDYCPEYREWVDLMIVDDWDEVCRENTDIEAMSRLGLRKEATQSLDAVIANRSLAELNPRHVAMFNPMGMAVFDIAVAAYYYRLALRREIGTLLTD
jgi:ornithine cyclodeaminase